MKRLVATIALSVTSVCFADSSFYHGTFESGVRGSEWSGAGAVESVAGYSMFNGPPGSTGGFGQWHLRNTTSSASTLSLENLPPHFSILLVVNLLEWDDLDASKDVLQVKIDGRTLLSSAIGGGSGPGSKNVPPSNYGYGSATDYSFVFGLGVTHRANTLTIDFSNPAAGGNSGSFGLDNVSVYLTPAQVVPEPSTLLLTGIGLLAIAGRRFRGAA